LKYNDFPSKSGTDKGIVILFDIADAPATGAMFKTPRSIP
jgi:hypothetical protein